MTALDKNRVNHAYLFSGPRGCGKTTSARILARCLNCAKGPTAHPCGECESCIELARGGSGSLDVIEIDAASHGGVDDARDLRERATFAPIRDRYKIFIIDEAHMVTSAGFNALLKIVEEPPEHIKFIFATTEPDKVIGTIRSRTHHYPFRLVPPEPLMAYLAQLCESENVPVAPGVLSLVVRAGGGSVRDSLSVLDQLMAGAAATGLDYDLAVDLLGYTHSSLLDDVVEALAAGDSATVFKSVDRVIQTGHDPRRFVEDLLERFRDLIIVQAMPESAHAILRGTPDELIARMQTQAAQLGAAELSRAADVTNAAFNEMTGATSPRLHLELLGARLLLPGADASARGMATRLDQMERRLNYGGATAAQASHAPAESAPPSAAQFAATAAAPADTGGTSGGLAAVRAQLAKAKEAAGAEVAARHAPTAAAVAEAPAVSPQPAAEQPAPEQPAPVQVEPVQVQPVQVPQPQPATPAKVEQAARSWDDLPTPAGGPAFAGQQEQQHPEPAQPQAAEPAAPARPEATPEQAAPAAPAASGSTGIEVIRRAWPEILGALRNIRMASWVIVNQNVVPQTFDGQELRVGLPSSGLIATFRNSGHLENLQQAIKEVLGMSVQILPADGEAPKVSAEPNPKVQAASPSPRGGGPASSAQPVAGGPVDSPQPTAQPQGGANPAPLATQAAHPAPLAAQPAPPAQAAEPAQAESSAPAVDSWGLPTAQHAAPQPEARPAASAPEPPQVQVQAPAAKAPAKDEQPQAPAPAASQAAPAPMEQAPWDGPTEPSDPWDEPHPDSDPYAGADPYQGGYSQPQDSSPQPAQAQAESAGDPQPAAPAAYTPPKVSPISAWTTGWDTPVETPAEAVAPAGQEAPRRSELLARKMAEQAGQQQGGNAAQDWGVSLGQTKRSDVADPGWGATADAPDWAQPAAATQDASPAAPAAPEAAPVAAPPVADPAEARAVEAPADVNGTAAPEPMSRYQRLANSSEAQAGRAQAPAVAAATTYVEDVPSPDDVTIEESGVVGQAAVERILGGVLIEERPLNQSS